MASGPRLRREGFPKEARLLKRPAFTHAYRTGRRIQGRRFVLFAAATGTGGLKVGITTPKKVGDAVVRNRLRRQVREIARRWRAAPGNGTAGLALVVNVTPLAREASFSVLREELESLLRRAAGGRP